MLTSFALRDGSRTLTNPTPLLTPSGSSAPHACHISRRFHLMPPVHQRTHTALMPSTYRRTHLVHLRESHATPLATGTTTPTYAATNNRRFARLSSACGRSRRAAPRILSNGIPTPINDSKNNRPYTPARLGLFFSQGPCEALAQSKFHANHTIIHLILHAIVLHILSLFPCKCLFFYVIDMQSPRCYDRLQNIYPVASSAPRTSISSRLT